VASLSLKRTVRGVTASGLIVAGIAMAPTSPAFADPQIPANASQAEQQLAALGHQAEAVNEQLLGAQVNLDAKRAQQVTAEGQLATADAVVRDAQGKQEQFRGTVDALTSASYQGARLNRLSALMISNSPQDLLDQMSGLDVLATDTTQRVNRFASASAEAAKAESDAHNATSSAKAASDGAAALQVDLQKKQDELTNQSDAVRAKYNSLTQAERINYAGTTVPAGFVSPVPMAAVPAATVPAATVPAAIAPAATVPAAIAPAAIAPAATAPAAIAPAAIAPANAPVAGVSAPRPAATSAGAPSSQKPATAAMPALAPGSSSGAGALQAALSKLGSPYVYGATGPNAFDCSGLTQWAFKQVGISIPRTAEAQAGSGTPVSRDQLQPGDLVFFYSPVSHVGIYAGNGNVVHASTEGQPVKVAPMQYMPFNGARRY
jgi:cell wall-associated NlpC family hydrolase